jgi:protein ImuA
MPSASLDLFGDPIGGALRLPTRRERQRVAPVRKPPALPRWGLERQAPTLPSIQPLRPPLPAPAAAPEPILPPSRLSPELLALHPQLWGGTQLGKSDARCLPSGFALLDAELPGGGWPTRAITELQVEGELVWRLLAPALAPACQAGQRLLLIGPPHAPHPPGLAAWGIPASSCLWVEAPSAYERQWALEQALKADADEVAAVLAWLPGAPPRALRRAQALAVRCRAPVFLLQASQSRASAAPLRLRVQASRHWSYLQLELLKRRGPPAEGPLWLPAPPPSLQAVLPLAVAAHRPALPAALRSLLAL